MKCKTKDIKSSQMLVDVERFIAAARRRWIARLWRSAGDPAVVLTDLVIHLLRGRPG